MPHLRPQTKSVKKGKYRRCPKCHKLLQIHTKRCRTCHLQQPR
jgi:uncharacterized protein (DUF983 family)